MFRKIRVRIYFLIVIGNPLLIILTQILNIVFFKIIIIKLFLH